MVVFFKQTPTRQEQIQRLTLKSHQKNNIGKLTLQWKWTISKDIPKAITVDNSHIENILNRQTVNLSDIQLTQSETNLLRKGLNICPTPPPPGKYDIDKDIDAFARRLTLKEYHTPENVEEIKDGPLNHRFLKNETKRSARRILDLQGNHTFICIY